MEKHIHEDCHVHVRCPECGGNTFEIMIYEKAPMIKCTKDGSSIEFDKDLIAEFVKGLHPKN